MVLSLGEWLSIPVCLAGFVLFYGVSLTFKDQDAGPHPRETMGFCAIGLLSVGGLMLEETSAKVVIRLGLIGLIFAIIGGRLFLYQRGRAGPASD